jgi:hypothetical protein
VNTRKLLSLLSLYLLYQTYPLPASANPVSVVSELKPSLSSTLVTKPKAPPPPLTSVEALLHGTSNITAQDQQRPDSVIGPAHLSAGHPMNPLQHEPPLTIHPPTPTSRV